MHVALISHWRTHFRLSSAER